ncbi:MAG: DUF1080 domain-containing protein [Candidatus Sumerlaeota bacterium]|nr:DUF1080 domain-containing protein [Candidatus Sumerlaeota bacterium]
MAALCAVALVAGGCRLISNAPSASGGGEWRSLFDGKTLDGWKVTEFGGNEEAVAVEDGAIVLDVGAGDLNGVTYTRPTPTMNYEVELQAMRVDGTDFFCGLTFPVNDSCCTLIVGGWGGSLIGISSFDGLDASENETTTYRNFDNDYWYRIRLRATPDRIEAWIGDEKAVDAHPGGREIAVRGEVDLSQPFGLAAWNTKAALRNIRVRTLE